MKSPKINKNKDKLDSEQRDIFFETLVSIQDNDIQASNTYDDLHYFLKERGQCLYSVLHHQDLEEIRYFENIGVYHVEGTTICVSLMNILNLENLPNDFPKDFPDNHILLRVASHTSARNIIDKVKNYFPSFIKIDKGLLRYLLPPC